MNKHEGASASNPDTQANTGPESKPPVAERNPSSASELGQVSLSFLASPKSRGDIEGIFDGMKGYDY